MGKLIGEAEAEVGLAAAILDYYADAGTASDPGQHVNAQLILLKGMRLQSNSRQPPHSSE